VPHPKQHQNQARCGRGRRVEICRALSFLSESSLRTL